MILLPYRFCGDSHHAFAFPFVLIFLPLRLSCKENSTSNQAFLLRRKDVTALLGARNRYAIRLAGHQSPRQVLRDGTARLLLADEERVLQRCSQQPENTAKTFDGPPTLERSGSEHRVGRLHPSFLRREGLVRMWSSPCRRDGEVEKFLL